MNKVDLAFQRLKTGYSCAQSVFSVFADELGLGREISLKVASAFGGGIAGTGETCGAVTGALMALGLKYGSTEASENHDEQEIHRYAEAFLGRIKSKNGTITCREILGVNIAIPEELKKAEESGLFEKKCPPFVKLSIEIADNLISRPKHVLRDEQ